MNEMFKNEELKLLDAWVIYPISDSKWIGPIQVVPKKRCMILVKNENGDLVTIRTVIGLHMCIGYRKLNKATRKDHFPLPYIDQMLERLAKHSHFFYLDCYVGFFKILIHLSYQEKVTFTFPYDTFACRQMSFGLCNAPTIFQRFTMSIFYDFL